MGKVSTNVPKRRSDRCAARRADAKSKNFEQVISTENNVIDEANDIVVTENWPDVKFEQVETIDFPIKEEWQQDPWNNVPESEVMTPIDTCEEIKTQVVVVVKEEIDIPEDIVEAHDETISIHDTQVSLEIDEEKNKSNEPNSSKLVQLRKELNIKIDFEEGPGGSKICPYCKSAINDTGISMKTHMANNHPEKLLDNQRQPHIPPEFFRCICKALLNQERNLKGQHFDCPYCHKSSEYGGLVKVHILEFHYIQFVKMLVDIQGNEDAIKKLVPHKRKESKPTRNSVQWSQIAQLQHDLKLCDANGTERNNVSWKLKMDQLCENSADDPCLIHCPVCLANSNQKVKFMAVEQLHFHMLNRHSEKFLQVGMLHDISEDQFKISCSQLFETEINSAKREQENGISFECGYCHTGCKFEYENFLKIHLIKAHLEILSEKLNKV